MNSYRDTLQKLYSVNQQRGVKFGLANMLELSNFFSHPERNYPTIHIAGSNGKGSVTTKIAKAYEFSGKRIGLYTSPHLSTYRERISINGVFIEPWEVEKTLNEIMTAAEENSIPATFFELTTLLAFCYFAEKNVDLAVIETGLGGRFDATNIVTPLLSIITSISLEHTEILGNSLEEIAYEKAGIIKPGVPVIVGPRVPLQPVSDLAGRLGSSYIQVEGNFSWFDEENNAISKKALETLKLPEEFIEEGVKALPPCRMEIVKESPKVILDVAHNPDGLLHLFQAIQKKHPNRPFRVVCGF
jgi:dihydrofolate synthase/folylpolyglutamate synthase